MAVMGGPKDQDLALPSTAMDPPMTRLYRVWKGRNKFSCGGRLIFGPDVSSVFLTTFLIGVPSLTFCFKMFTKLPELDFLYGHIVFTVALILTFLDLTFLFMTASRNPGIIPRNSQPPLSECASISMASMGWGHYETGDFMIPRMKDVYVNGILVRVKFCDTCLLFRPPRASHCSICNNCVQRFDHHCPWVGQCIGARNYKTFILFVTTSTVLCVYVFTFCLMNLLEEPGSFSRNMSRDILSFVLMVYSFISVWFVGGLSVLHFYLMCSNQTTYENFRYRYDKRLNPYNIGVVRNLKEILFSKTVSSLINFREWVIDDDDYSVVGSVNGRYLGNDVVKQNGIMDLEGGILGKDEKQKLNMLHGLDCEEMEEGLKKEKTMSADYFIQGGESLDGDDYGTEDSSQRASSAVLTN